MDKYKDKKISILGTSVSTYAGVTSAETSFYGPDRHWETGVIRSADTWWGMLIGKLGAALEVNDSVSGSTVCGFNEAAGSSDERTGRLGSPDVILVCMGTNDCAFGVPWWSFEEHYDAMLAKLKTNYPAALIICASCTGGELAEGMTERFFSEHSLRHLDKINELIGSCAKKAGCRFADLAAAGVRPETVDGVHPTRRGMETISNLWLDAIR